MVQSQRATWFDGFWLLSFGVVSALWCVTAAGQLSATFDEPFYIQSGLQAWRTGSHAALLREGTMPLPAAVQTLPLYLWERWHGIALDAGADLPRLIPWARLMTLVFWGLLLVHAWLLGRRLAGPWAGRLAVALLALEPSCLAHAALATTDIAVSAFVLAFLYHFLANRESRWAWRVAWPALWFGLAILAKASGLVFGGLCLLTVEAERLARRSGTWRGTLRDAVQIGFLGLGVAFVLCGSDWQPQPSFITWAQRLPEGLWRGPMVFLAENLRIFTNAGEGIVRQVKHNIHGHGVYLLGRTHLTSLWYYFPVLLTIKLTLTLLLLPAAVLLTRGRALLNTAGLAALVLLLFSLNCRVQIGLRLILPLVTLLAIATAGGVVQACRIDGPSVRRRRFLIAAAGLGVAWSALSAVLTWPHGLCYVNEAWGGSRDGYRLVSDSNYDWGQGLHDLARWQQQHKIDNLDVWYFGSDPYLSQMPVRHLPLHALPLRNSEDLLAFLRGRYLAVSTTLRYGLPVNNPELHLANAVLDQYQPIARTTTYLIYDFTSVHDAKAASAPK